MRRLSEAVGLERIHLRLGRVPPGKESFIYHSHQTEEEFVYILSGRGRAEIDDKAFEVGPGDFMGFPAPSVAHHLTNPHEEDLVYLMGGERHSLEIGTFPRLGKRLIFDAGRIFLVDDKDLVPTSMDQWLRKDRT